MVEKLISLNAWNDNNITINASQGEVGTRQIRMELLNNSEHINLSNCTVRVYFNNNEEYNECTIENELNGIAYFYLTSVMCENIGKFSLEVHIVNLDESVTKFTGMSLMVFKAPINNAIKSSDEYTALDEALGKFNYWNDMFQFKYDEIQTMVGPQGEPFTYDDFTTEQLESLKVKGADGTSPTVTVVEDTDTSYKLSLTDKDGTIITPNLKDKFNPEIDTYSALSTTDKTIIGAINENFTSVDNGKTLIASAITDKGVATSNTDTFSAMASNIGEIETGYPIGTDGLITGDIVIPDSVTSLGNYAFYRQPVISVSGTNNVTTLGEYCFYGATSLTTVDLPNVTTLGEYCFYGATSLTTVSLPSATTLGNNCFYSATSLTTVSLPSATTLGNNCFYSATSLTTVDLPNVTTLGKHCFYGATSLTTVSLPSATTLGNNCFYSATSLTTVDLPNVTSINYYFCYNAPLTHLTVNSTANSITLVSTTASSNNYSAWKLPVDDMVAFGNALKTASTATGIKFKAEYWNAALSTSQKAIFTNKNYTITAV